MILGFFLIPKEAEKVLGCVRMGEGGTPPPIHPQLRPGTTQYMPGPAVAVPQGHHIPPRSLSHPGLFSSRRQAEDNKEGNEHPWSFFKL